MRRRLASGSALLLLALAIACASSPPKVSFDVLGTTAVAVDTTMKIYADLVVAGKIPQPRQEKVRKAFEIYQIAMADAKIAVDAWFEIGAPAGAFPSAPVGKALIAAGEVQAEAR